MFAGLPYYSHIAPAMRAWDMKVISQTGPSIAEGTIKAQGLKAKPASRVRAAQSEGRINTNGGQ
jgi:hypothetical protein